MKHVRLAALVFALLLSVGAHADDNAHERATDASVELKLSKTLTLNPTGEAPRPSFNEAPQPTTGTSDVSAGGVPAWTLWALVAIPVAFWFGLRQTRPQLRAAHTAQQDLLEQVDVLKEAVIESGSGPRNEWQSTLSSLHAELREKTRYIDRLHDQNSSSSKQLEEFEQLLQDQADALTRQQQDHDAAMKSQADDLLERFTESGNRTKLTLEAQANEAQIALEIATSEHEQQLQAQAKQSQDSLDQLEERLQNALDENSRTTEHAQTVQAQLDALREEHAALETRFDSAQSELEPAAARLSELENALSEQQQSARGQKDQMAALNQRNADLEKSLVETTEQLNKSIENADSQVAAAEQQAEKTLSQELEKARAEFDQRLAKNLAEYQSLRESLDEAERENQHAETLRQTIGELETALANRDEKIKEIEADFAFSSESAEAALNDRDKDLETMIAKVNALSQSDDSLKQLRQDHEALTNAFEQKEQRLAEVETLLSQSTVQSDELAAAQQQLQLNDAELAQMQSIIVETEEALTSARKELQHQSKQLNQQSLAATQSASENASLAAKIEQMETELTAKSRDEAHAAKQIASFDSDRVTFEQTIAAKDHELEQLLDSVRNLEKEHERQSNLITTLESTVVQLESDLILRENENTETLKMLEIVNDQSAALEERAGSADLLDSHIEELEAQLEREKAERLETGARLTETTTSQMQLVEQQQLRAVELESELDTLKRSLESEHQSNEHLRKTLDQARKYREELEENTRDLEKENRELSQLSTKTREELAITRKALQESSQKVSTRDEKLLDLQSQLEARSSELKSTKSELHHMFDKVDRLTASLAQIETDDSGGESALLSEELEQSRDELQKRTRQLKDTSDSLEQQQRNANALQEQLSRYQEDLTQKEEQANSLSTQLIELSEQREQHLARISELENRLDAMPEAKNSTTAAERGAAPPNVEPDYAESMRARENIIAALEDELARADITIAGLRQKLEDTQIAEVAEQRADEKSTQPISEAELEKLKTALMNKSRQVQSLRNEIKVNKDLVKVFENDSNMLHDTELKLDAQEDHNQFLEHELAKAVTENQTLKSELDKAAKRLARHQNIGRTVSQDTRLAQLKSRLSLLENENKEQLEVIAQLRSQQMGHS